MYLAVITERTPTEDGKDINTYYVNFGNLIQLSRYLEEYEMNFGCLVSLTVTSQSHDFFKIREEPKGGIAEHPQFIPKNIGKDKIRAEQQKDALEDLQDSQLDSTNPKKSGKEK